jgi:hypothetical protein
MRHLAINEPRGPVALPALAAPASPGHADADYRSYLRAHLRVGPILTACIVWGLVLLFYFVMMAPARADPLRQDDQAHYQFSPTVCYELVQDAGRMIAWARWEQGFSLEKTRSAPFPANTPPWMIALVQDWITDAYQWQATDEQILQWASELGNVEDLPHPAQLSRHETIAIWMRHIARQCAARSA